MSEVTSQTDSITSFVLYKEELRAVEVRPGFISKQSFNFAGNYKPGRTGLGCIHVFNDDLVEDQTGIPLHPHKNYEILSVLLSGEMVHEDNLGNSLRVKANEVKLMSAGSGLFHGGVCYGPTNFLQIWIQPSQEGTAPAIRKQSFNVNNRSNQWQLQVSPNADDGVLTIKQKLYAYRGTFEKNQHWDFRANGNYLAFLMPLAGSLQMKDHCVASRDSAEFCFRDAFSFYTNETTDAWLMIQEL